MTVSQMINELNKIKENHGDVEVYFDCPKCDISFAANSAVKKVIHLTGKQSSANPRQRRSS